MDLRFVMLVVEDFIVLLLLWIDIFLYDLFFEMGNFKLEIICVFLLFVFCFKVMIFLFVISCVIFLFLRFLDKLKDILLFVVLCC